MMIAPQIRKRRLHQCQQHTLSRAVRASTVMKRKNERNRIGRRSSFEESRSHSGVRVRRTEAACRYECPAETFATEPIGPAKLHAAPNSERQKDYRQCRDRQRISFLHPANST